MYQGNPFFDAVVGGQLAVGLPVALLAGLISFLSPCVLPLVPGYLGYVGGLTTGATEARARRRDRRRLEHMAQILAGERLRICRDFFGRALGNDPATAIAAFGTEVDDPVRALDHIEVVLDNHDGVTAIRQPLEDVDMLRDIGEMQTSRRLVKDVDRLARRPAREL